MGGYLSVVRDHGKRLDEHDTVHREIEKHDAKQDIALTKLEAWLDGYNAARVVYDSAYNLRPPRAIRTFKKVRDDEEEI
jgi:hypothetical protein